MGEAVGEGECEVEGELLDAYKGEGHCRVGQECGVEGDDEGERWGELEGDDEEEDEPERKW